jgi:hypothetical protein
MIKMMLMTMISTLRVRAGSAMCSACGKWSKVPAAARPKGASVPAATHRDPVLSVLPPRSGCALSKPSTAGGYVTWFTTSRGRAPALAKKTSHRCRVDAGLTAQDRREGGMARTESEKRKGERGADDGPMNHSPSQRKNITLKYFLLIRTLTQAYTHSLTHVERERKRESIMCNHPTYTRVYARKHKHTKKDKHTFIISMMMTMMIIIIINK